MRRKQVTIEERERILNLWSSKHHYYSLNTISEMTGRNRNTVSTVVFNARMNGDPRAKKRNQDIGAHRSDEQKDQA